MIIRITLKAFTAWGLRRKLRRFHGYSLVYYSIKPFFVIFSRHTAKLIKDDSNRPCYFRQVTGPVTDKET